MKSFFREGDFYTTEEGLDFYNKMYSILEKEIEEMFINNYSMLEVCYLICDAVKIITDGYITKQKIEDYNKMILKEEKQRLNK
jgi:hypothetical protein